MNKRTSCGSAKTVRRREVLDPLRDLDDAVIDDNMRRFAEARAYGRSRHSTNGSKAASQRIASLC